MDEFLNFLDREMDTMSIGTFFVTLSTFMVGDLGDKPMKEITKEDWDKIMFRCAMLRSETEGRMLVE